MLNLPRSSVKAETTNVMTVHAVNERYVLTTARCCSSPEAAPPLKLGQNIHKKRQPKVE